MGSFSWTKADNLTQVANIVYGKPFKFLIPKKYGGGFIKDRYQDYGDLGTRVNANGENEVKYDMYELLAFWNAGLTVNEEQPVWNGSTYETYPAGTAVRELLKFDGEFPNMKECDKYTEINRSIGINIGCYDEQVDKLIFPLKLVSASYTGTYEECEGKSYGDPNQGWSPLSRKEFEKMQERRRKNKR